MSPENAEIIEFTRQLRRRHRVDDASAKAPLARFANNGFIQLTGAIGYYSMLAMTVNACELEAGPNAEVLDVERLLPTSAMSAKAYPALQYFTMGGSRWQGGRRRGDHHNIAGKRGSTE